jgi:hypothetical protein
VSAVQRSQQCSQIPKGASLASRFLFLVSCFLELAAPSSQQLQGKRDLPPPGPARAPGREKAPRGAGAPPGTCRLAAGSTTPSRFPARRASAVGALGGARRRRARARRNKKI